ncbi:TetR family transcriptional regulator [Thermoleophilia bacterium SCSIO 60948]|nr:TetR family transcriptional regulator [Thermoleophilia bacterium SCSIO 60948]
MATSAEDTRARILDAACALIAAEGIDDVRIARVATRARVSSALIHHYFSTREELLAEALRHSYERAGDDRFAADPETLDGDVARLAQALAASLPLPGPQSEEWVLWFELWLRAVRDPALRPVAAELYARYHEWFAGVLRRGVEAGTFRADLDVDGAADVIVGLTDGLSIRALLGDPGMDLGRIGALLTESVAGLVGVEPAELRRSLDELTAG